MSKRNLFAEISEGIGALQAEREGRLTLQRVALSGQCSSSSGMKTPRLTPWPPAKKV